MAKALIDEIQEIRKKAAKAIDGKGEFPRKIRVADSRGLSKTLKHLGKDLGNTPMFNRVEQIIDNLCKELENGDNSVDLMKIRNLCDTAIRSL